MIDIILDALIDSLKMIPFMLIVFIAIEFFEHKFGNNFRPMLKSSKAVGPFVGSLLGILPQCGFSVMSSLLFAEGVISMGTLVAVYIATSDEAIPVILSQPGRINVLLPLIITKLVIALCAGYIIDLCFKFFHKNNENKNVHLIEHDYDDKGCCGHTCIEEEFHLKDIFMHSVSHTLKVVLYVFAVSLTLNIALYYVGEDRLSNIFLRGNILQPVLTSVVGLIPNCAASVAITQVFLSHDISFGSAISGLSSSAGLGLIVLFKETKNKKDIAVILFLLLFFSILSGIILNNILPSDFLLR